MKEYNNKSEKGFVLVTVMLLTMMGSTIVLTSLQDTTVQERLSGNFQKKINSRLMAEKGVFDAMNSMNSTITTIADGSQTYTTEEVLAALEDDMTGGAGEGQYIVKIASDGSSEVTITSKGELFEGQTQMEAVFELVTGSGSSEALPYASGVSACKAIDVEGSGTIDSYDSSLGIYDPENNVSDEVTVQTIDSDSAVVLDGNTDIDGNVISADSVTFSGSAKISGNVEAISAINATMGGGNVSIGGNVSTEGTLDQTNGVIGGNIHANGAVTLNGTPVGGNIISRSTVEVTGSGTSSITYPDDTVNAYSGVHGYILAVGGVTLSQPAITGSVHTHNSYSQTGGTVSGGVLAEGNITLPNGGTISGGAATHSDYSQSGGVVNGGVLAEGIITLSNATIATGGAATHTSYIQTGGNVSGGVTAIQDIFLKRNNYTINGGVVYGGSGGWIGGGDDQFPYAPAESLPNVSDALDVADVPIFESNIIGGGSGSSASCDPEGIEAQVAAVADGVEFAKNLYVSGSGDVYTLNALNADFTLNNDSESLLRDMQNPETVRDDPDADNTATIARSVMFFGAQENVLMYTEVEVDGNLDVGANQDVVMYVQGDFTMANDSALNIPSGSSLTLIIEGKLSITGGTAVNTPANGITASGKPVFSIYSSYSGEDEGIYFTGGTETAYAVIYAPLTNVTIDSGVSFSGSVYGNNVTVTGSGGVHYDTALGNRNTSPGSSGGSAALIFKGWRYITDEDSDDPVDDSTSGS